MYKLIARRTIEERMIELQGRKKELARDFLDGDGESASIQEEDINRLFTARFNSIAITSNYTPNQIFHTRRRTALAVAEDVVRLHYQCSRT